MKRSEKKYHRFKVAVNAKGEHEAFSDRFISMALPLSTDSLVGLYHHKDICKCTHYNNLYRSMIKLERLLDYVGKPSAKC